MARLSFTSTFGAAEVQAARIFWRGQGLACSASSAVGTGRGWLEGVGEKDAIGGGARLAGGRPWPKGSRRPCWAGVLILTCGAAVLLLLLLVVRNKLGGVQGVGGQGLSLQGRGGALRGGGRDVGRGGQGCGLVAPRERWSAQARLLRPQQPALGLGALSAPLSFQAAVVPFFLLPLQAGQTKAKVRQGSAGTRAHPTSLRSAGKGGFTPRHTECEARGRGRWSMAVTGRETGRSAWQLPPEAPGPAHAALG